MNTLSKISLVLSILIFTGCTVSDIKSDIKSKIKSKIRLDKTAPIIKLLSLKETKLKRSENLIVINSNEKGTIVYEPRCKGDLKKVVKGENTLTFSSLDSGYYDFCRVSVVDAAGNYSKSIKLPLFRIGTDKVTISQVSVIPHITSDETPSYTFRSTSSGVIKYRGSCQSEAKRAFRGNNTITFTAQSNGLFDECYIKVIDDNLVASNELHISAFKIDKRKEFELVDELVVKRLATLDESLSESSGMVVIDGRIYTHNDSGGEAAIFEIDSFGQILRKIVIKNALNIDWESMTQDDKFIYIADIGNNEGKRADLKIYKIKKDKLAFKNTLNCEVINIKYSEQEVFKYRKLTTPFDAEALLSYGDKLFLFTKNWRDKTTVLYEIEKKVGSYEIKEKDEYKFDFLITDATFHKATNSVVLIGYDSMFMTNQKIVLLRDFEGKSFFSGEVKEFTISNPPYGFKQIEAVAFKDDNSLYITSESVSNKHLGNHPSSLFEVELF